MDKFRCDHLHLRSLDPDASARFYEKMFGAKRLGTARNAGKLRVTVELAGVTLCIDQVAPGPPATPEPPYPGLEQFGRADRADRASRELKQGGQAP